MALAIPTVLLTSLVVFLMLFLTPGDPASIYVGEEHGRWTPIEERRSLG